MPETEISYLYPSDNPFVDRGNENVGFLEYRYTGKGIIDSPCKVFLPMPKFSPEVTEAIDAEVGGLWGKTCNTEHVCIKFTRSIGNNVDNTFKAEGEELKKGGATDQEIVDAWQKTVVEHEVGAVRKATGGQKQKAKELDSIKAEAAESGLGTDMAAILAAAKAAKDAGLV